MDGRKVVWADVGDAVQSLIGSVQRKAVIVAPFITDGAFRRLLEVCPLRAELLVITRWRASDIAAGVSDTRIMDRIAERSGHLRLHPRLHAKIYLADQRCALVGSANVTDVALGFAAAPNREMLVELQPLPTTVLAFLRRIEREAVEASDELRRAVEAGAADLRASAKPVNCEPAVAEGGARREWYPSLRNPDRLYALYRTLADASADEREAALEDLAEIAVDDGLDQSAFCNAVARHLVACPHLVQFDAFLATPRRFGELTEWLKGRSHKSRAVDHRESQRCIQTLIRWLLFFLPERYVLKQPNYSELFGRREAFR